MKTKSPKADYRAKTKSLSECKSIRECCFWYLVETEGKKRDLELERNFITYLYECQCRELEEELKEMEERKSEILNFIESAGNFENREVVKPKSNCKVLMPSDEEPDKGATLNEIIYGPLLD